MKYKLVCIDLDRTLLNDDKCITERSKNVISKINKNGVKVAICTGRLYMSAAYYSEELAIPIDIIASNGALIKSVEKEKVVFKQSLEKYDCQEIIKILNKYKLKVHLHSSDKIFIEGTPFKSEVIDRSQSNKKIEVRSIEDWNSTINYLSHDIYKVLTINDDINIIDKAKRELNNVKELNAVSSLNNNIEIMKYNVSKGEAVKKLAEFYGYSSNEVICIGDNDNDISMLKYAGLGIAMKNGSLEAKRAANIISDKDSNNNGVAEVLEEIIKCHY